jgi:hypothetical protein
MVDQDTTPLQITIMSPGEPQTRINPNEIATFDLRLSGYTLTDFLDTSRSLGPPKYATLKVQYRDGTIREWYFSKDGYSADYENPPDGPRQLRLTSQTVTEA